ncbi:hypothetical protein BB561_005777 [Smittium simulii]|uniref:UBC core domain-containing protein n=1 Tax=Smittium simulii TaxID=133385 RepID=A0A2T9Y8B8_9FUNG|nr:hypothetical protein BB561_005777 [Smittium simulii]
MSGQGNAKSPSIRRILSEWKELQKEPPTNFRAFPNEDDIFLWHFMIEGPKDTVYEGGQYHGKLVLPAQYPHKPPKLIFLTKNGRFETNVRICLSITDYHPESWQPSWGIRTLLTALIGFFPASGVGHAGAVQTSDALRKKYALESQKQSCELCASFLDNNDSDDDNQILSEELGKPPAFIKPEHMDPQDIHLDNPTLQETIQDPIVSTNVSKSSAVKEPPVIIEPARNAEYRYYYSRGFSAAHVPNF